MIERIVSGGQTGVDRAALDAAMELGVGCGGWCPRGRRAEDGPIPDRYLLTETTSANYAIRTEHNIRDSDGTLILCRGPLTGGTALTRSLARRSKRPLLVIDISKAELINVLPGWCEDHEITSLNIAGPRESQQPGIYEQARDWLINALRGSVTRKS